MLTEVKLENFRVFDEEVTFRLRPITVLIGRNSAGKSTLIKFLLMLQQSLDGSESGFLTLEGERVHLGAFADLRNSVSRRPHLKFQLRFKTKDLPSPIERKMFEASRQGKLRFDPVTQKRELRLVITGKDTEVVQESQEAEYDVFSRIRYSRRRQSGSHSVKVTLDGEKQFRRLSTNLATTQFLQFPPRSAEPNQFLENMFSDRFLHPIRAEVRSWKHLSAIRQESQRAIVTASPPADDVGQMGQYAMPHLQRIVNQGGDAADFVLRHTEAVVDVGNVRFDSSMKGYLAHCWATNRRTKGESYLSDFGFGVSQCVPIFVQGVLMRENQLLMVEQPEAQLHPTAQIEMGSFFAELWSERKVMSIIETHSPQIILRLRRLVGRGKLNNEDLSVAYVHENEQGISVVENLGVDEAGNLQKGLPMEFFGADIIESMKLGVKE
jgi:predicted ATPase